MAATICQAFRNQEGDILAFLPGQGEIMKCEELLRSALSSTEIYPLYGNLSPEKQRLAIAPSKPGERKIVLATPIAELLSPSKGYESLWIPDSAENWFMMPVQA